MGVRVVVAGGGIGGLTAAMCLHRAGIDVEVHETVTEPTELGVGINVLPHSVRVLDELGLLDTLDEIALRTGSLMFLSRDGTRIWSEPRGLDAGNPWPQFSVHRGRLHMALLDAAIARLGADRVHTGHRLVCVSDGLEDDAAQATGVFLDRRRDEHVEVEADVIVGADGIHSALRAQLYPDQGHPHPSGLVLWRGAVEAPAFLDGRTMFMAGDDDQKAVVYPLRAPGTDGRALVNWVAERPVDVDMATVSWNREVDVGEVAAHFGDWDFGWLHVGELIASSAAAYEFPMVDRHPVERWSFGRVTLLGDAAHPMRPNGSNGSSQAILDGESLANALVAAGAADGEVGTDGVVAALRAYETERLEPTARLTLANRQSGPERVMQWVADRCSGDCGDQHTCVDPADLEREANAYKQLAGFDLEHLRSLDRR